jgi:cysteinyl-tRNA synthetase
LEGLDESHKILWGWYGELKNSKALDTVPDEVLAALGDDLNSSGAIAELHSLRKRGHLDALKSALGFLGFSCELERIYRRSIGAQVVVPTATVVGARQVDPLIIERNAARARKDFKESDRIRDELAAMGVVLKDGKDADGKPVTTWEIAR